MNAIGKMPTTKRETQANPRMTPAAVIQLAGWTTCPEEVRQACYRQADELGRQREEAAPEVEPFGIRTMLVEPGFFRTELLTEDSTNYPEPSIDDYAEKTRETVTASVTCHRGPPASVVLQPHADWSVQRETWPIAAVVQATPLSRLFQVV